VYVTSYAIFIVDSDFISMKIYFLYIVSLLPTCLVKCCGDEDDKMIDVGLNYDT
jgi:hypothetical protein